MSRSSLRRAASNVRCRLRRAVLRFDPRHRLAATLGGDDAPKTIVLSPSDPQRVSALASDDPTSERTVEVVGTVRIDAEGFVQVLTGHEALDAAHQAGRRQVTVTVVDRHAAWRAFRRQLRTTLLARSEALYQRPPHPDLQDLPYAHAGDERFAAMHPAVTASSGRLLDIGSNLGYFCHRFEHLGFDCVGVEASADVAYVAEHLRRAARRRFRVVNQDIFSFLQREPRFDLVLALNILHHFLRTKASFQSLTDGLKQLDTNEMMFEPSATPLANAYAAFDEDAFVAYVQETADLPQAQHLIRCSDGRSIYRLWRT